jgi:hypothetical protein
MPDYLIPDYRSFTVFYLLTLRKLDFKPVSELFKVKSDDSLTLDNIKRKNSLAEDTGGTLRHLSAKHAWSKLRKTSRCSIARLFNTKRVITPWNVAFFFSVLHVHRLK